MTEQFILELYIGKRNSFTTMVAKREHIAAELRKFVWTNCRVFHWQQIQVDHRFADSLHGGWVLRAEYPYAPLGNFD